MEFEMYRSIQGKENAGWNNFLFHVRLEGIDKEIWQVTEKVHGSNFSVWYDGVEVKFARRKDFLGEEESFFNFRKFVPELTIKIKEAWNILETQALRLKNVAIFGEMFGGSYEHPDVKRVNAKMINKGVFYSPDVHFYAYDLKINGEFVNYDSVVWLFEQIGIFYAKVLFEGTLNECMEYSNEFQTTIPEQLGFPPIENNICEGIVVKPKFPHVLKYDVHAIYKSKNVKFQENKSVKIPKSPPKEISEEGKQFICILESMITRNRLDNVMSKIGEFDVKKFGEVIKDFNLDILEEFKREHEYEFGLLDKVEQKMVTKTINKYSVSFLKLELFK